MRGLPILLFETWHLPDLTGGGTCGVIPIDSSGALFVLGFDPKQCNEIYSQDIPYSQPGICSKLCLDNGRA